MSNFLLLTKALFKNSLSTNKKTGKQSFGFYILLGAFLAICVGVGSWAFFVYGGKTGISNATFAVMLLIALSVLTLILTFFQMHTTLFKCPDYDFLASLPFKNRSIISAKLFALFISNFLVDFISVIILAILYVVYVPINPWIGFLCILVGGLFCDAVPILISTLVGALIALITAKLKHSDLVSIVLYVVFFLAISAGLAILTVSGGEIVNIKYGLPYFIWLEDSILTGNLLGLLYFVLINLAAIIVVVVFVSLLYTPLNQIKPRNNSEAYVLGSNKGESINHVFFKKEVNLVLKNGTFFLSSYVSPIIFFVLTLIFYGFINKGFLGEGTSEKAIYYLTNSATFTGMFIACVSTTTYASFSMEGNNFKLLATYPISPREIIRAKIKAGLIPLVSMFALVGAILCLLGLFCSNFNFPAYGWFNLIVLPSLAAAVTTFVGTLCGLKWIRLDFKDPNDVLKKSKALGMFLFFSFILNIVAICIFIVGNNLLPGLLGSAISKDVMPWIVAGITTVYYVILLIILSILVKHRGLKLFNKALEK